MWELISCVLEFLFMLNQEPAPLIGPYAYATMIRSWNTGMIEFICFEGFLCVDGSACRSCSEQRHCHVCIGQGVFGPLLTLRP